MHNQILNILYSAGKIIAERIHTRKEISHKSTYVDLVTEVDREVELRMIDALQKLMPGSEFLSEETQNRIREADKLWILDPIDGTLNFVHGFPMLCISLALQTGGVLRKAFVYNPVLGDLFEAENGKGTLHNGKTVRVSENREYRDCLLATGFPYDYADNPDNNIRLFDFFHRQVQGVRRPGSAALDLAYTAAGVFDGFWEQHLKPWDVAAGMLLVREAGGIVTNFAGLPYCFGDDNILAGNPCIHASMLKDINTLRKES
ncbi:MAG: inositol monophosphatase family protein [Candidatus Neomarinimicrobiota bacterium]|jgi:myo-inositol-1(or 4)-monophosphatase|nr:inositol monophosphatase family protein [Candidatus Neomarinimicrobiota bacterium]